MTQLSEWRAMLDNLRLAEDETGRAARVVVDLPGPKLRTGPLAPSRPATAKETTYASASEIACY